MSVAGSRRKAFRLSTVMAVFGGIMQAQARRKSDKQHVADEFCKRFGATAVQKKYCTVEQVKAAMTEQLEDDINGREHRLLGSILYDKGWINEAQIDAVLQELKNGLR